jgi:hypothetical protein
LTFLAVLVAPALAQFLARSWVCARLSARFLLQTFEDSMSDPYIAVISEQWTNIAQLYNQFADKYPVMLVDLGDHSLHAFPSSEFRSLLDTSSQVAFDEQYKRAVANRQMVLFVRDLENKVFQSYSLQLEDDGGAKEQS